MLVDFEKAFDSLNWNFLYYSLESYGFGPRFINLVKTLYTNISSAVINNGYTTEYISLKMGIRQGCPASAFLFIICSELLACQIRNNTNIKGLSVGNYDYKIMQFTDDTVIFTQNMQGIKESLLFIVGWT